MYVNKGIVTNESPYAAWKVTADWYAPLVDKSVYNMLLVKNHTIKIVCVCVRVCVCVCKNSEVSSRFNGVVSFATPEHLSNRLPVTYCPRKWNPMLHSVFSTSRHLSLRLSLLRWVSINLDHGAEPTCAVTYRHFTMSTERTWTRMWQVTVTRPAGT
jgi:hypothetical protein